MGYIVEQFGRVATALGRGFRYRLFLFLTSCDPFT